jgi:hypothetical protein
MGGLWEISPAWIARLRQDARLAVSICTTLCRPTLGVGAGSRRHDQLRWPAEIIYRFAARTQKGYAT